MNLLYYYYISLILASIYYREFVKRDVFKNEILKSFMHEEVLQSLGNKKALIQKAVFPLEFKGIMNFYTFFRTLSEYMLKDTTK